MPACFFHRRALYLSGLPELERCHADFQLELPHEMGFIAIAALERDLLYPQIGEFQKLLCFPDALLDHIIHQIDIEQLLWKKAAALLSAAGLMLTAGLTVPQQTMHAGAASQTIINDCFWKDTSGNFIYSQGGGIFKFGDTYYWCGVHYSGEIEHETAGARM